MQGAAAGGPTPLPAPRAADRSAVPLGSVSAAQSEHLIGLVTFS